VTASGDALLLVAVGLLLAVAVLASLQSLASSLLQTYVGERLVIGFRAELFRHAQRLSLSYHDAEGTADATYRIQKDAASVEDLLVGGLIPLLTAALTAAVMVAVVLWLDWPLGLVALAVAPALLFASGYCRPRLRRQSRE